MARDPHQFSERRGKKEMIPMNHTDQWIYQQDNSTNPMSVCANLHCRLSSLKSMVLPTRALFLNTYTIVILLMALTLLTLFVTSLRPTHVEIQGTQGNTSVHIPLEEHSDM